MHNMLKKIGVITSLSGLLILSGCTEKVSPIDNMYTSLEGVVSSEKGYNEQQDSLRDLEKREHELYEQIIGLSMNEFDEIVSLSQEALSLVEERESKIELERQSMIESEEKFNEVQDIVATIEDEELKKEAEALIETMNSRYEAHKELYDAYVKGIQLDKDLYTLLQDENLTLEQLQSKITEINEAYEIVLASNESFNKITEEYNNAKKEFYESAGMEVTVTADQS
ncbi:YkyA family protein [Bacillus carboniphilus]|uniref:YkyA family protein n=1 Tax=Bacillus carboniphilus TaxID=86663 RepID=A0ABP3FVN9_9BACI